MKVCVLISDEASGPPREHPATGLAKQLAGTGSLLAAALTRQNLQLAWKRVNHDILIDRLKRRIDDAGVIRLIRAYLNAGIMDGGVVVDCHLGTPQGRRAAQSAAGQCVARRSGQGVGGAGLQLCALR